MTDLALLRIQDDAGNPLLVVRRSDDGQAGEVIVSTPTVSIKVRVPEIARAFDALAAPANGRVPWSARLV